MMPLTGRLVEESVRWLGHAGFMLKGKRVVYIDPYNLKSPEIADIVLVTHDHYDHCSPDDIKWLRKGSTVIVCPEACADKFEGDIRVVKPGDTITVKEVQIEAVPAYNLGKAFHPQTADAVGYVVTTVEGLRVYHAGDTDFVPEMKQIKCDIALLPVGGKYTMTADEAAEVANLIKPMYAIPMHWGAIIGSKQDAERFRDLCEVKVKILRPKP